MFGGNRLVLAVPADGDKVASLEDVQQEGGKLAIRAEDVPVGIYTRTVLDKLPAAQPKAILANVHTEEPDVAGITGKLTQRAVDAGFLHITERARDRRRARGDRAAGRLSRRPSLRWASGGGVLRWFAGAARPSRARARRP